MCQTVRVTGRDIGKRIISKEAERTKTPGIQKRTLNPCEVTFDTELLVSALGGYMV